MAPLLTAEEPLRLSFQTWLASHPRTAQEGYQLDDRRSGYHDDQGALGAVMSLFIVVSTSSRM